MYDGASHLNKDDIKALEALLKLPNGKPLRAQTPMDLWSLGMIAYELFVNEPYFAGCSDDVALQVLASAAPLDLPTSRIAEPQAEHLLRKILVKRAKERATVEAIMRHAYVAGGLDTQEVGGSFAMLHESQQTFKGELSKMQGGLNPGGGARAHAAASFLQPAAGGGGGGAQRGGSFKSFGKSAALSEKRAKFSEAQGEPGSSSGGGGDGAGRSVFSVLAEREGFMGEH